MRYVAKLIPIYFDKGYPRAPVDVTDENGKVVRYYRQIGGGVTDGKSEVTDPDILLAIKDAQLAEFGLKRIDQK